MDLLVSTVVFLVAAMLKLERLLVGAEVDLLELWQNYTLATIR